MKQTLNFWSFLFIIVPLFQWGTFSVIESVVRPFQNASTINLGTTYSVTIESPGQMLYYRFTPTLSSTYTFSSTGTLDTVGYLYSSIYLPITTDDDRGPAYNFTMSSFLTANTAYYLVVKLWNLDQIGSFSISVSRT